MGAPSAASSGTPEPPSEPCVGVVSGTGSVEHTGAQERALPPSFPGKGGVLIFKGGTADAALLARGRPRCRRPARLRGWPGLT
mmetsp:Transcript_114900/g.320061  ORF Transcript_114900/g.320061 Transcript_114900/m.320061 type:complete len:83 (-) Transcript_114900:610-858(-)